MIMGDNKLRENMCGMFKWRSEFLKPAYWHVCPQGGTTVVLQNVPDHTCQWRPQRNAGTALHGVVVKLSGCPAQSALAAGKCHPCWAKQKLPGIIIRKTFVMEVNSDV